MKKLLHLFITLSLASCATTDSLKVSTIKENTVLTKLNTYSPITDEEKDEFGDEIKFVLDVYQLEKEEIALVEIKKNKLELTLFNDKLKPIQSDTFLKPDENIRKYLNQNIKDAKWKVPYEYVYYGLIDTLRDISNYKLLKSHVNDATTFEGDFKIGDTFNYKTSTTNLQSLTIPFKIRFKQDSISSQISTGVNVGLSIAFKRQLKSYAPISAKSNSAPISYKESNFEYSIAPFLGVTTIDLTAANTGNEMNKDKKVFGLSYGVIGTIGINKFDLGLGFGFDAGLNKESKNWIYQNKPWLGIVLGLDLVK